MSASCRPDPAVPDRGFSRPLAIMVAGAFFMENLDATVIAPAAPAIAADFGVAPVQVNVTLTAYLLTVAVLIPGTGWLAERFGPRRIFGLAIAVFTVASVACALAPNLPLLTAARVLQGVGGAMMVPVGRLAVLRTTRKTSLIQAIAYLTWPALLAPVLAPFVGGLLTTYASWRWIFLLNVPLGVVGLLASRRLMPARLDDGETGAHPGGRRRFDRTGFLLTAVGVAALVLGLEQIGASGHGAGTAWAQVLATLGVAAVVLAVDVRHLRRTPEPLLDLRTLRHRTLRITVSGGLVYRLVISAVPFLVPLWLQLGFGWTAAQAGAVLVALFAGNVGVKPFTTPLLRRFGVRTLLLAALLIGAACLVALAFVGPGTPTGVLVAVLAASGVFRSIGFTAYNTAAFADVPGPEMAHANTLNATVQELGAGLGIAVGALLVRLGESLGPAMIAATAPDMPYRVAFIGLAVLLIGPTVEVFTLSRTAGGDVTGRG